MREGAIMESPELAEVENFETLENPHETERSELLHRLEQRIDTFLEMKKTVESLRPETVPDVFAETLDTSFIRQLKSFPEAATEKFIRVRKIEIRAGGEKILPADQATINDLLADEDARFLWNIDRVRSSLIDKHEAVYGISQDLPKVPTEQTLMIGGEKVSLNNVDIGLDSVHITLGLEESDYKRVRGEHSKGAHFVGSPISIIRRTEDADEYQSVIHHEAIHNFTDAAPNIGSNPRENLQELISSTDTSLQPAKLTETSDRPSPPLPRVDRILDTFHDELLAHLDAVEWDIIKVSKNNTPDKELKFIWYAVNYATAGRDALEIDSSLRALSARDPEGHEEQKSNTLSEDFTRRFTETIEMMQTGLERGKALGPEVFERVHALLFVLPPSKYRHVSRYLDSIEKGK